MRAAVLSNGVLRVTDVPRPVAGPGQVLLRVRACGVCRTDLHIVDGELPPLRDAGDSRSSDCRRGRRARARVSAFPGSAARTGRARIAGAGWRIFATRRPSPATRVDGGYAEYALARADFVFPLPDALDDLHAAPLLCAGIIGFRSLRVAGVERGERVGLFGFGASAHLAIAVLRAWGCDVYVATRGRGAPAIWRNRWARCGSARRRNARRWRSIAQ